VRFNSVLAVHLPGAEGTGRLVPAGPAESESAARIGCPTRLPV